MQIDTLDISTYQKVFFTDFSLNIHIIRDDLLHPFISGNKFRKLEGFLRISKECKIKKWITFGGAWSNHLVATACAGAMNGIQTFAYIRGEKVKNPVLFLCKQWGMQMEFISRSDYRLFTQYRYTQHFIEKDTLWIPEGGSDTLAFEGFKELIFNLPNKAKYLFTAVGTGTTLAGLCHYEHPSNIVGIAVLKAENIFDKYLQKVKKKPILLHDYHLGGYANTTTKYLNFLTNFSKNTGILLDPIYTGKMVYAVYDLIKKNFFDKNDNLYLLHTGGLTGILGKWEKYPD